MAYKREEIKVSRLHCPSCARKLEHRMAAMEGVVEAKVDLLAEKVYVTYDPRRINVAELDRAVTKISGHIAHPEDAHEGRLEGTLTLVAGALLLGGIAAHLVGGVLLGTVWGTPVHHLLGGHATEEFRRPVLAHGVIHDRLTLPPSPICTRVTSVI